MRTNPVAVFGRRSPKSGPLWCHSGVSPHFESRVGSFLTCPLLISTTTTRTIMTSPPHPHSSTQHTQLSIRPTLLETWSRQSPMVYPCEFGIASLSAPRPASLVYHWSGFRDPSHRFVVGQLRIWFVAMEASKGSGLWRHPGTF
jgi:hypothetical protein